MIVGSTLHISMGSAEFKSVNTSSDEMIIELTDGGARNGKIFLHYSGALSVKNAEGCNVSIDTEEADIHILSLSDRIRGEENRVSLTF